MKNEGFYRARYGVDPYEGFTESQIRQVLTRGQQIWLMMSQLTGSSAHGPIIKLVHTPRALPAFIHTRGVFEGELIWDAGLGTILGKFSELRRSNHSSKPAIEAILRQIVAVRALLCGQVEQATAQVHEANQLLAKQVPVEAGLNPPSAQDSHEQYLAIELQEQFILGHELAHHLRAVDGSAFLEFVNFVEGILGLSPKDLGELAEYIDRLHVPLGEAERSDPAAATRNDAGQSLHDLGGFPYAVDRSTFPDEVAHARDHYYSQPSDVQEELLCDLLSGIVVSCWCHRRSVADSASLACSSAMAALWGLGTLMSIDDWLAGDDAHLATVSNPVSSRERSLSALLPLFLNFVNIGEQHLPGHTRGWHQDMVRARESLQSVIASNLKNIGLFDDEVLESASPPDAILREAGFDNFRPRPDPYRANPDLNWRDSRECILDVGAVKITSMVANYVNDSVEFRMWIDAILWRHAQGDWGDVDEEDVELNNSGVFEEWLAPTPERLRFRGALYSRYSNGNHTVHIRTNPDRMNTTVFFIEEM